MSKRYETIKRYFDTGAWDASHVGDAVKKGWITAGEFEMITGGGV